MTKILQTAATASQPQPAAQPINKKAPGQRGLYTAQKALDTAQKALETADSRKEETSSAWQEIYKEKTKLLSNPDTSRENLTAISKAERAAWKKFSTAFDKKEIASVILWQAQARAKAAPGVAKAAALVAEAAQAAAADKAYYRHFKPVKEKSKALKKWGLIAFLLMAAAGALFKGKNHLPPTDSLTNYFWQASPAPVATPAVKQVAKQAAAPAAKQASEEQAAAPPLTALERSRNRATSTSKK